MSLYRAGRDTGPSEDTVNLVLPSGRPQELNIAGPTEIRDSLHLKCLRRPARRSQGPGRGPCPRSHRTQLLTPTQSFLSAR